jgi:hypothetical protein
MDRKERKALANKVELQIKDATNYINDMSTKRRPDLLAAVKRGHEVGKSIPATDPNRHATSLEQKCGSTLS